MSNDDGRNVNCPRSLQVRLNRFISVPNGEHGPSSLTVYISATSGMHACMNAQWSYPGYTVTDVMQA